MNPALNLRRIWFVLVAGVVLTASAISARAQEAAPSEAERNAALEQSLSGAALVGHFTVTGRGEMRPREERYELASVKHLEGDIWLITARIKYGENDVELPLPLPILWAGDTPVITVDEFAFPGLGTYTARVMIYQDHYAGFWSGKDHGGHLFGTIERPHGEEMAAQADQAAARAQIAVVKAAVRIYQLNMAQYPSSLNDLFEKPTDPKLAEKWGEPYLAERLPPDPWGNEFQYASPGEHNPDSFDVWSNGPDGESGTDDDIGNWE